MYFEKTLNKRMKHGIELVQIRYTKDNPFFNVKAGDLGGWVSEQAFLAQNGKWFLGENAEVFGGSIYGGSIYGGEILGGDIRGGYIHGGWIYGGRIYGGRIYGGVIRGGRIYGGWIYGGEIRGGEIHGGGIYGGVIRGGEIRGGYFNGDLPNDFGQVPCLIGGRYPVNFAGYSKTGERKFACGCQIHEESKWTPEFMKSLSKEHNFTEQERIQAEELFEVVKKMTPEKTLNRDPKTGRFLKKSP